MSEPQTKICEICHQTFARRSSRATNDGWRMRLVCYQAECKLALKKIREDRAFDKRRQEQREAALKPKPRCTLAEIYAGRRYQDVTPAEARQILLRKP